MESLSGALLLCWRFEPFSESRWCTVGVSCLSAQISSNGVPQHGGKHVTTWPVDGVSDTRHARNDI
eukprot:795233-Amphidinium_carterae.1